MGDVQVIEARTTETVAAWARYPRQTIYSTADSWVPPLDRDLIRVLDRRRNPFFRYGDAVALLAVDGRGAYVGRALAHVYNRHNARHLERAAFFGYFECSNDGCVASALIEAASEFGARSECTVLRGPFNMTAMQEMGILVDGFGETPAVDQTYTAAYYPALLEGAGLRPTFPHSTYVVDDLSSVDPDAMLTDRHWQLIRDCRLQVRPADLDNWAREIETLRELLNDSFYDNPHFVSITRDEFHFQVDPYRRLMDPEISLVMEVGGVPCGFVIAVPDFNVLLKQFGGRVSPRSLLTFVRGRSNIRDACLIVMGVQRQLQGAGVMRVLTSELIRALRRRNYQRLFVTWVADANLRSIATVKAICGRPLHRLTLYEMPLAHRSASSAGS